MRINFILATLDICGGVKVVFEYANRLSKRGHEVTIIWVNRTTYPFKPRDYLNYAVRKVLDVIRKTKSPQKLYKQVDWFDLSEDINVITVPTPSERYIPDADITISTWWEFTWWMSRYSPKKGKKIYLIQHYEVWGGYKEEVEQSYLLGQANIVISGWLKNILEKLGAKIEAMIPNGLNFQEFYPEKVDRNENIRVLLPYRKISWKGIEDGIEAFHIVQRRYPKIQLVMFGPPPDKEKIPVNAEFHVNPVKDQLRKIYNSCDIFVFPSHCEGFGLPPMEAMACCRPVVTTDVGAICEYTIPGQTALVCPPKDINALANCIFELVENPLKREQIARNGYNYIQQFTWDKSIDKLEKIFYKFSQSK